MAQKSQWTRKAFQSRIANASKRERYEAGSLNAQEIEAYTSHILSHFKGQTVGKRSLVLGMTPELRLMLHELGMSVICVDRNPDAIALFSDWIPELYQENEKILEVNWMTLGKEIKTPVDIVVGDGVFGNILSLEAHEKLLKKIGQILALNGIAIFRKILIPNNFPESDYCYQRLIQKYRSHQLDASEFGFAMRIWGLKTRAFDREKYLLDNQILFNYFDQLSSENNLSKDESNAISRYYFNGLNLISPQHIWESLLTKQNFNFEVKTLTGKDWYAYYRIYACKQSH